MQDGVGLGCPNLLCGKIRVQIPEEREGNSKKNAIICHLPLQVYVFPEQKHCTSIRKQ